MKIPLNIIESYADLLSWAERANMSCTTGQRVILQDEFARVEVKLMEKLILQAIDKDHRRLILFGIYKIQGDTWLETYLRLWSKQIVAKQAAKQADKENEVLEQEWEKINRERNAVWTREVALQEHRKPIHKKIRSLRDRIRDLEAANLRSKENEKYWQHQAQIANGYANQWEKDATKWQNFQAMVKEERHVQ